MKRVIIISLISLFFLPSCQTGGPNNSVSKKIKKQKRRQKRNPNDCPRIDC